MAPQLATEAAPWPRPPTEMPRSKSIDMLSNKSRRPSLAKITSSDTGRKFSLPAALVPRLGTGGDRDRMKASNQLTEKVEELLLRVPDVVDKDTGRPMRDLAREDLVATPEQHVLKVAEEYARIPRNMRVSTMLSIKLDRRKAISDRVQKARAALLANLELQSGTARSSGAVELPTPANDTKYPIKPRVDSMAQPLTVHIEAEEEKERKRSSASSSLFKYEGSTGTGEATTSTRTSTSDERTSFNDTSRLSAQSNLFGKWKSSAQFEGRMIRRQSIGTVETFTRIAKEVGALPKYAPITASLVQALAPRSSRSSIVQIETPPPKQKASTFHSGSKEPSADNPFASFITEKSDHVAEKLPTELRLCYFTHNEVQEQMRTLWRQKDEHMTAESIAKEVWDRLPVKEFQASIPFEGEYCVERPLEKAQLEYMWVLRFWERCKIEKW